MSEEKVELVRRMVQAFNERDVPNLESIYSEDVVMRLIGGFADLMGTEFRGQDAVLTWMKDWVGTIGGRAEIETIREVEDRVLVIATVVTAGTLSGTPATLRYGQVYSFRDERISAFDSYYSADEALKAVGLTDSAMSENLDLVRSIYSAWERGDFSSAEWAHPEIEFVIADGPSPGTWTGLSGLAEGHRAWLSAWEDFRSQAQEYRELDDERVLVLSRYSGRGKTSGLELGQMGANGASVAHIREGKVTRLVWYTNRDRALANLGLEG